MSMLAFVTRLLKDRRGTSAMEYALMCAMIVLAMVSALSGFANVAVLTWGNIATQTANAVSQSAA